MSLEPGTRVSHYQLVKRLGAGGMGEVFLADDLQLHRPVAIKFLTAPTDEHARRRLMREARAVAALDYPSICAVYEIDTDPARGDFIVMPYLDGESLAVRLQRGRMPVGEALAMASQIADALGVAHRQGIVHRDLKPQNVILMRNGVPKLLDFGIAKYLDESAAGEDVTASRLTRPHAAIGTPGYMAPEQVRNQQIDARSDLFALGSVLYECLTGRFAFNGTTSAEIFGEVLHVEPPPPSTVMSDLTPAHDALCALLLQKDPAARFQSAEEVHGAIRALLPTTSSTGARPAPPVDARARARRLWIGAGAIAGIVALAFAGWQFLTPAGLPPAPAEAAGWHARGVEALRDGSFAGARASFEEAIKLFPDYVQAYSRLAEACAELDDERCAQTSLLRVGALVPDRSRLAAEDADRLSAVQSIVLRDFDRAIAGYQAIAERHRSEAGAWLDLGRAEEAVGRRTAARDHYAQAVSLDAQYAAAHLRLGAVQAAGGETAAAHRSLDEAIRLYRAGANVEGEGEALLRKSIVFINAGEFDAARDALARLAQVAAEPRYVSLRIRGRFELVRVTSSEGRFADAEALARETVREAEAAGLHGVAAGGLIELGNALMVATQVEAAEAQFERARQLASATGALRTEMRARLGQASLRLMAPRRPAEAIALAQAPLKFFVENKYPRQEASAKNILSRAHELLEQYTEASRFAMEVLAYAESIGDRNMAATPMENLAGQLTSLGRLPEALSYRERIEQVHRDRKNLSVLPLDLTNRAELLIQLGRGADAEAVLAEVDRGIAAGTEAFVRRRRRVAQLRALQAVIDRRYADAERLGAIGAADPSVPVDDTARLSLAIGEYARAELGRSRVAPADLAKGPSDIVSPTTRREVSYWVARTLAARRESALAYQVAVEAWSAPGAADNDEIRWRLAAVAAQAVRDGATGPDGASMPAHARSALQRLTTAWPGAAAYLARRDLATLRQLGS